MNSSNEKKSKQQGVYMPIEMINEIKEMAAKLDRPFSWVVARAWSLSREQIAKMPAVDNAEG
jgi:uncharacterized small protein (TIGR04563 family)